MATVLQFKSRMKKTPKEEAVVTFGMLNMVRNELISKNSELQNALQSLEKKMESRLDGMDAKIQRMLFLMEEQKIENKAFYDHILSLEARHERFENKVKEHLDLD